MSTTVKKIVRSEDRMLNYCLYSADKYNMQVPVFQYILFIYSLILLYLSTFVL